MREIVNRPWGTYEVLDEGPNYKVKKIIVNPGHRTSLQYHEQRQEHWSFVSGSGSIRKSEYMPGIPDYMVTAKVSVGDLIDVWEEDHHQVINDGAEPLIFIETQIGVCDENDILRLDDNYGRQVKNSKE